MSYKQRPFSEYEFKHHNKRYWRRRVIKSLQEKYKKGHYGGYAPSDIIPDISGQLIGRRLRELEQQNLVDSGASQLTDWRTVWYLTEKGEKIKLTKVK